MIVTNAEATLLQLLEEGSFIRNGEAAQAPAMLARIPAAAIIPPSLEHPGDLMIVGAHGLLRQELSLISYPLLRRVLFSRMAREQFEEAAALLMTLSDPLVLSRLFADLRTSGKMEWGIPNGETFFALAFDYVGLTLGAMSPVEAAGLVAVLAERGRREKSGEELTGQLAMAFGSIHPSGLEKASSTTGPLPFLSVLIGTLLETKETQRFAEGLVEVGLNPEHPSYPQFYAALDHLHDRHPAFTSPFDVENGAKEIFDAKKAKAETVATGKTTLLQKLAGRGNASLFEIPATTLAKRQEIIARLQRRLKEVLDQDSISENQLSLLSDMILLTLTSADVWQLTEGDAVRVAKLLRQQPSDVIVAFFKGWGSNASDEEDFPKMGKVLVALWKSNGKRGRITTREAIRLGLEDTLAVTVLQKALSLHGTDGDLMTAQMELYAELADTDHLGGAINPYDTFVVSGVLKPEDLEGRLKAVACRRALEMLEDLDEYGRINMRRHERIVAGFGVGVTETRKRGGIYLEEEEQQAWRTKAVEMLVRLGADGREVTDYLMAALPTKIDTTAVTPLDPPMNEKRLLYFEALDKLDPHRLADKYLLPIFKKEQSEFVSLKAFYGKNGLRHQSAQLLLLKLLHKEEKVYQNYGDPNNRSDETEVEATLAVGALMHQGNAGLDFLFYELGGNNSTWVRMFIYVAERVATPLAHKRLRELYHARPKKPGLVGHETDSAITDALLFALEEMDNDPHRYYGPKANDVYFHYLFEGFGKADLNLSLLALEKLVRNVGPAAIEERVAKSELLSRFFAAASEKGTGAMDKLVVTGSRLEHRFDHRQTDWRLIPLFHPQLSAAIALLTTLKGTERYGEDAVRTLFKLYHALHKHAGLQRWVLPQQPSEYLERVLSKIEEENAEQFTHPSDLEFFRKKS